MYYSIYIFNIFNIGANKNFVFFFINEAFYIIQLHCITLKNTIFSADISPFVFVDILHLLLRQLDSVCGGGGGGGCLFLLWKKKE